MPDPQVVHALGTASRYQLTAALFLLILIVVYRNFPSMWVVVSQVCVSVGVLFFCISIYLHHLFGLSIFAKLAPIGGISFMLSFLALLPLIMWL